MQELDKIMETPGNLEQIYFKMFSDCSPPVKSGLVQLPS